jgi:hypothetical protein
MLKKQEDKIQTKKLDNQMIKENNLQELILLEIH